jgi:hypothetical protein
MEFQVCRRGRATQWVVMPVEVGSCEVEAIGEERDQIAKHAAGAREAMQQEQCGASAAPASR